jgi:hypothetical protein
LYIDVKYPQLVEWFFTLFSSVNLGIAVPNIAPLQILKYNMTAPKPFDNFGVNAFFFSNGMDNLIIIFGLCGAYILNKIFLSLLTVKSKKIVKTIP